MGGKAEQPKVTQESQNVLGPEQKALFDVAFPYAQKYASTPLQMYGGSGVVGLNPTEVQAAEMMKAGGAMGGQLGTAAGQAQAKLLDPSFMLDPASNEYLQRANAVTTQDITRNLTENVLPQVRQGSTQAGGMYSGGSSREGIAEGLAIGRTSSAISDAITRANYDAYFKGLGGLQGAIAQNPNVQAQQLFDPAVLSAVGGQERALEQAKVDEAIRNFYTQQALPFIQAQELMSLIQGMPGGKTVSTTTGAVPPGPNKLQGAAGGALAGAGAGSTFGPVGTIVGGAGGGILGYLTGR